MKEAPRSQAPDRLSTKQRNNGNCNLKTEGRDAERGWME